MGRWSFIGIGPRSVLRWSLGDGGDPYELASRELQPLRAGAGRGRRPRSRAARSASSAMTSCARSSRSGIRRAIALGLPDMALMLSDALVIFDHLKHTVTILANADLVEEPDIELAYGKAASRIEELRRALAGPVPRPAGGERTREPPSVRVEHAPRAVRSDGRADRPLHPCRRRLPGRALPALVGAGAGRGLLDLPRPARDQPEPVHVLPGLRRLPGRRREPRAAADRHRPARLDQADRRHPPARRLARGGPRASPPSCWPTRRSAPST